MERQPRMAVVGSINIDLTAFLERLPGPGETIGRGRLVRQVGGKGANQAVAAAKLGARVRMIGAVGTDSDGSTAREALAAQGIDTSAVRELEESTGVALILVDRSGENEIAVCEGANAAASLDYATFDRDEAVLTQLETPLDLALSLAELVPGYLALNASPATRIPAPLLRRCDLIIVNEGEYALMPELDSARLLAVTHGAAGAVLRERGKVIASADGVPVDPVNAVGAGDCFAAALVVALLSGHAPQQALRAACRVGAAAVVDPASQPSLKRLESYLSD